MRLAAALAFATFLISPAFADPTGSYTAKGTGPGGKPVYAGTVQVDKTGDTYHVVWTIDGTEYIGTGLGNDDFIAVSYRSGSDTGLALYGKDGTGWKGIWTYAGASTIGMEIWTRQ